MTPSGKSLPKRLLILPPIIVGIAVLAWQVTGRQGPQQAEPSEVPRPVRVISPQPVAVVPRALGYGYVQPGAVWEAVAEVSGKVVYRHPDLERGRILAAGTEMLRIDETDYQLALAQIESNLESVSAQLAELDLREANTRSSLEIERRRTALASEELERKRALLLKGNASQASVDQAESDLLAQRQRLQDLENALNLIPAERRVLKASYALSDSQRKEAERDLERTTIRLPFDARIADVKVEATQFVSVGQQLVVADSIDVAEVSAQMAINHIRPLIRPAAGDSGSSIDIFEAGPRAWGLTAIVRLLLDEDPVVWEARIDRISDAIDPQTRTVGVIVAVDEPYRRARPGERPPLVKNMYVEVELRAPPLPERIVVPRVAVHRGPDGDRIYLADADDRLAIRRVKLQLVQSDFVVVGEGLSPGERVVISDLIPAIEGMLLSPSEDAELAARLVLQAGGATDLK